MAPNKKLLLKVADRIENDPDSYDQSFWGHKNACGTTMCIAGHAVAANGYRLIYEKSDGGQFYASECKKKKDEETFVIEYLASDLLGLPDGHRMFSSYYMHDEEPEAVANELRRIAIGDSPVPT